MEELLRHRRDAKLSVAVATYDPAVYVARVQRTKCSAALRFESHDGGSFEEGGDSESLCFLCDDVEVRWYQCSEAALSAQRRLPKSQ